MTPKQNTDCEIYEKYRRKYRPQKVKVLFLAEAPPPPENIENFIYYDEKNSMNKNALPAILQKLLVDAGFKCLDIRDWRKFLEKFRDLGFYLEDTIKCPLEKGGEEYQSAKYKITVDDLREINPEIIVVMGSKALEFIKSVYKSYSIIADGAITKLHGSVIRLPDKVSGLEAKYLVFSVLPTACQFLRRILDRPCIKPFKELRGILKDLEC